VVIVFWTLFRVAVVAKFGETAFFFLRYKEAVRKQPIFGQQFEPGVSLLSRSGVPGETVSGHSVPFPVTEQFIRKFLKQVLSALFIQFSEGSPL